MSQQFNEIPELKNLIFRQMGKELHRCFWPGEKCKGKAIKAHSIQNSRILDLLADHGHVVMFHAKTRLDAPPEPDFVEIGKNEATTFTGLCGMHDKQLFQRIDDEDLNLHDSEHKFLLAYRSLLREFHSKLQAARNMQGIFSKTVDLKRVDPNDVKHPMFQIATATIAESYSCYLYKYSYDAMYVKRMFDQLEHVVVLDEGAPSPIAVSGAYTLKDNMVNLKDRNDPKYIMLNVWPQMGGTCVVFSFKRDHRDELISHIREIQESTGHFRLYLLSKLILRHCENFVISPRHFRTISADALEAMKEYFNENLFIVKTDREDKRLYLF